MKLCIFSIAIGLGITITLASLADAVFFRPLPVPDANRVVRIPGFVSFKDLEDFKSAKSLTGLIAQTQVLLALGNGDERRVKLGLAVTGDYFDALRIRAASGRVFHERESREAVAVLAAGADPALVGKELQIGCAKFRVLGIAADGFGLDRFVHESFYIPMRVYQAGILPGSEQALEDRGRRFLTVVGRLAPDARIEPARVEIAAIAARLEREYPETNRGKAATVETEMESRMGGNPPVRPFAWMFAAMGAVALLMASANAAGLLLARAEARSREIAVKFALGATRVRLLREFACESIGVVLAGALLGFPAAWAAVRLLASAATLPTDFSFSIAPKFDARMAALTALALAAPALVCACAPMIAARQIEIGAALKQSASKWRGALVAIEIALSGALLMIGITLMDGVSKARRIDPGYRVEHVVVMAIDPLQNGYSKSQARMFFEALLDRASRVGGVRRVALAQSAVLGYMRAPASVEIENAARSEAISTWMNAVTPEYFALLRIPLIAGREFDERDRESSEGSAIVNQELAKRCPIGARIRINGRAVRVVGIARNVKYFDVHEPIQSHIYVPFAQNFAARMVLHAEVDEPMRAIPALLNAIREMDPAIAVSEARPLKESLDRGSMFSARAAAEVIGGVSVCVIFQALGGIYGTIAQFIARRRREIGIRAALGASRVNLIAWVMRRAMVLLASGIGCALVAGGAAIHVLSARVPGIDRFDASALLGIGGIAAATIIVALSVAIRAARVSPSVLLRTE